MKDYSTVSYPVNKHDIYTFIPNLIGFSRVLTLVLSFFTMKNHPILMFILYSVSCILDAFDGFYARKYGQSTQFGAVLDMVTDRCSTCSLIVFLGVLYPDWFICWQILISLDLASHYVHMYAQINSGSNSHKKLKEDTNWLLKLYYENRTFLFLVCAFNEIFYICLYLRAFDLWGFDKFAGLLVWICVPVWGFKQVCNVIQLVNACEILVELDSQRMNKDKEN
ncbi:CDP-diacylglycerol--inositol 3-phosphatidyltransferase [Martiniozyma asiatica (nom. inval.)]|nr:CDP-diacylglycerol--inositol 3-phosphatidyltransferase [Martiniozyma asiatica]